MTAASIGDLAGRFMGRRKNKLDPDLPTDPVRSHSWDVDSRKAKPGKPIGDGSAAHFWAFRRALRKWVRERYQEQYREKYRGPGQLQRSHFAVLDAAIAQLDRRTGDLFVDYATLARNACCSRETAVQAIAALEELGVINHVRRSRRIEGAEGIAGPQREQACNGYYFDCRRRMGGDWWKRLWTLFKETLNVLGAVARRRAHMLLETMNEVASPAPRRPRLAADEDKLPEDPALRAAVIRAGAALGVSFRSASG